MFRRGTPELTAWDVNPLNPMNPSRLMQRVTRAQAELHWQTKQVIRSLPRSIFGIAILKALGMPLPRPPSPKSDTATGPTITQEQLRETNERMSQIRAELAAEAAPVIVDTGAEKVEELQDSVQYAEAQTTFEAHMRASQLRDSIKA